MDKGIFVKDIKDGQQVEGIFLVKEMSRGETRNGKPYLALQLMDNSGEIAARLWENAHQFQDLCPAGSFISVSAQAQAFRDVLQLKIVSLRPIASAEVETSLFMPATGKDVEAMWADLLDFVRSFEDESLRQLLDAFCADASFRERFSRAPAAKHMHHAYLGGLLEHTLAVCRLVEAVCRLYPFLDRDLLLAGAVLHDAGKIEEFSYDTPPFNYSDRGRLEGHMVLCVQMLQEKLRRLPAFPAERASLLKHLILSHHGRHEFGSPTLPMTLEAFVLNLLDDLDAKANYIGRLGDRLEDDSYQWSDYQRTLERFLFIRKMDDAPNPEGLTAMHEGPISPPKGPAGKTSSKKEASDSIQPSLFDR